jgi:polyisoprenoid-binding protein YceI
MKKITLILVAALSVSLFSFNTSEKATWTLDKNHAKLGFSITHLMVSDVEGLFKSFDAKITSSASDFSDAVVEMTADVNSISTENEMRDKDLKGPNYFDAAKYPTLTFKSKTFKKVKDNTYKVTGDLTMHGVTKPVELDVLCRLGTNPQSKKTIAGFKITGKLNRKDFGIGSGAPEAMVSNEVALVANAEFVKD